MLEPISTKSTTIDDVALWLQRNECPMTSAALYHEWQRVHNGDICDALLDTASDSINLNSHIRGEAEAAVVEMLILYGQQKGRAAIKRAAEAALSQLPESTNMTPPQQTVTAVGRMPSAGGAENAGKHIPSPRAAGAELTTTTTATATATMGSQDDVARVMTMLSERLPILVQVVDPMRKDVLIPLILLVATFGGKKSTRAAARMLLLTLYSRPGREHRVAVADAWALAVQQSPRAFLESDVVPELYSLANAKAAERHILVLDCVERMAPLLAQDAVLRLTLGEGLLWALSSDGSRTVRSHVVRCLVELWPQLDNSTITTTSPTTIGNGSNNATGTTSNITTTTAASVVVVHSGPSLECISRFTELLVRFALHDTSGTVQRRSLLALGSLMPPRRTPPRILLERLVPLFMSILATEVAHAHSSTPLVSTGPIALKKGVLGNPTDEGAVGDALHDMAENATPSHTVAVLSELMETAIRHAHSVDGVNVFDAYVRIVLPSAYALVLTNAEQENFDAAICAVASALTTMAPIFGSEEWRHVRASLEAAVLEEPELVSQHVSHWRRRRLCFFFAFLTRIAGDEGGSSGEAIAMLRNMLLAQEHATGLDATARLDVCARALTWLTSRSDDDHAGAAAVSRVLWSLTESVAEQERMLVVALIERVSSLPKNDEVLALYIWPPLLVLMNDTTYAVSVAAVKAAVSMVMYISSPSAQEKVLKTALATVEAAGCTSKLNIAVMRHWCAVMREMPAEPRETYLYPLLSTLLDQLCTILSSSDGKGKGTKQMLSKEVEDALQSVFAVLAAIPHCAVVTPQLVRCFLIPGMRSLASANALPPANRSQLTGIMKEFDGLLEPSKVVRGTSGLLGRMRDELKKHF